MMNNIKIPENIVTKFVEVSSKNFSSDCGHIQTLAFLVGYKSNIDVIPTELIFPKQHGTPLKVDDLGK